MLRLPDSFITMLLLSSVVVLACCCGICVLLIGWRGKQAGVVLSGLVLACGLTIFFAAVLEIPRYWWISLLPTWLGIQSLGIWRRKQPARGISMRSFLVSIGFAGAVCAGISQLQQQRQLESTITQKIDSLMSGEIEYDFDGLATGLVVFEVQQASLDEMLSHMRQLKCLRRFQMNHCSLSLEQARQIGDMQSLEQLWLQGVGVDDAKLEQIARLRKLDSLDLMDNQVTGAGLKALWNATHLTHIWINSDSVTPADVELLRAKLPQLEISY